MKRLRLTLLLAAACRTYLVDAGQPSLAPLYIMGGVLLAEYAVNYKSTASSVELH
jgi:hypothetical protein